MSGYGVYVGTKTPSRGLTSSSRELRKAKREKMMKRSWRQRIRDWLLNDDSIVEEKLLSSPDRSNDADWGDGLKVNIKKVIGGFVVTFYRYNNHHDRVDDRHYIINDDQDFNQALGHLISMESMRN